MAKHMTEPDLLKRLRKAVQISGLTADLTALDPRQQTIVVTNRLAQTTVRYLASIDPATGQSLAEELRTLVSTEEYDLLMEDRGFTFFHLVQFLYEFAQTYADIPDPQYFCAGMGLGVLNKFIEPSTGAVWGKVLVLAVVIVFIQWRPEGLFPPKGRVADV